MPSGYRDDPFTGHNFLVEIDGVTKAGFLECSGLKAEVAVIEYRNGSEDITPRKLPGLKKFGNIVLKRGFTKDDSLWKWVKQVLDGKAERHAGSITLLSEAREPVLRWTFREAWPCKYEGPTLNAQANEVAIETIEIVIEDLRLEVP